MEKTKLLSLLAFLGIAIGTLFKIQHWPGANISLILGTLFLVIAILMGIGKNKESGASDMLNYLFSIALIVMTIGAIFKVMHWPGGGPLGMAGHIFMFIMPLLLLFQKDDAKMSNSFWTSYLIFVMLVVTMLVTFNHSHNQHHEGETPQEHMEEVQPGQ